MNRGRPPIIDELYAASQAGVDIELVGSGVCCLRTGVPGFPRISGESIVGPFPRAQPNLVLRRWRRAAHAEAEVYLTRRRMPRTLAAGRDRVPVRERDGKAQISDRDGRQNDRHRAELALDADGPSPQAARQGEKPFNLHHYLMTNPLFPGAERRCARAAPSQELRMPRDHWNRRGLLPRHRLRSSTSLNSVRLVVYRAPSASPHIFNGRSWPGLGREVARLERSRRRQKGVAAPALPPSDPDMAWPGRKSSRTRPSRRLKRQGSSFRRTDGFDPRSSGRRGRRGQGVISPPPMRRIIGTRRRKESNS